MKFNKTIALALANKTRQQLSKVHKELMSSYEIPEDINTKIEELVHTFITLKNSLEKTKESIENITGCYWNMYDDDEEEVVNTLKRSFISKNIFSIPCIDDLCDDFIILAMDCHDPDELINKVVNKYVKNVQVLKTCY